MKNKLLFLILSIGLLTLYFACQKDDSVYTEQNTKQKIPKIQTIAYDGNNAIFKQLKSQFNLDHHKRSRSPESLQGKSTTDTLGLIIETDIIKQVTLGDYTSYTMRIADNDSLVFYNLTIEYKNGASDMFITKYTPTEYWLNNKNEVYQGKVQSKRATLTQYTDPDEAFEEGGPGLDPDPGLDSGSGGGSSYFSDWSVHYPYDCFGVVLIDMRQTEIPCSCYPQHMPGEFCNCDQEGGTLPRVEILPYYSCQEYLGNPDPELENDPYDPNDGYFGGGSSLDPDPVDDNPPISTIIKETGRQEIPKTECESLKRLVDTDSLGSNILPYVNQLRARINLKKEWYLNYSNEWVGGNTRPVPDPNGVQEGESKTKSKLNYSALWVGQMHTHPKGTYKVFSWFDLQAIKLLYEETNNYFKPDVFIIVVAPNNETYALKVDDIQTLTTKIENDWNNAEGNTDERKDESIEKAMAKEYKKSTNLEQTFLELYGDYGIAFYKATDTNLSNWKKLELDENNSDTVNETPCN
ncbi:hypothetical protein [Winogradskyella sp.]|uniref:hypothetical protein n=1 Tax=Winogradskyella sp. TaxID=1883156 RepID=UPI002618C880|nr:hypothetical protein [Winogradskyella sp.]